MNWYDKIEKNYWASWMNHALYIHNDVIEKTDDQIFSRYMIPEVDEDNLDVEIISAFLLRIAALCVENGDVKNRVFTPKYQITPLDFYHISYLVNITALIRNQKVKSLLDVSRRILYSINDHSIIESPFLPIECESMSLSEDEIFDVLRSLPIKWAVNIIGHLDISQDRRQKIKEFIIVNDLNGFIEYSIRNAINFVQIENICCSLLIKHSLMQSYDNLIKMLEGKDYEPQINRTILDSNEIFSIAEELEPDLAKEINSINGGKKELFKYHVNLPQDMAFDIIWRVICNSVILTKHLKPLCPNYNLIVERDDLIHSWSMLESVDERFTITDLLDLPNFGIPALYEFKRRFITDIKLPPSWNYSKKKESYFSGYRYWNEGIIYNLYRLLTEQGILSWDESTCFSFLYRMSNQYKPSDEVSAQLLRPIYWCGSKRELLSLIYYFHEGDSRIWKKVATFFCTQQGEVIKIPAGAKNSAVLYTDRINNILSNSAFRK